MYLYRQAADAEPVEKIVNSETLDYDEWKRIVKGPKEWPQGAWPQTNGGGLEVAYWRKANAIHEWFVQTFQAGVDECQFSDPIGREGLAGLVERCKRILAGEDPSTLLPSKPGFFFGGTDYDESYRRDLEDTIAQLTPLIAERNTDVFIYHASW